MSAEKPSKITPITSHRGPWLQLGTPAGFEWNRYDLPIDGLPPVLQGLKIVHLTDLHLRTPWCGAYDELIAQVNAAAPDLILITGDIIEGLFDYRKNIPSADRVLSQLSARLGIYAILGNHDGDLLGPHLGAWGVQLLAGRWIGLQSDDAEIELIGIPGVFRGDDIQSFIRKIPRGEKANCGLSWLTILIKPKRLHGSSPT